MNEEALKSIYDNLDYESRGVSFDKFKSVMDSNSDARNAVYKKLNFESRGVSFDKFESKLGYSSKKKEDTAAPSPLVSSLDQDSTDSTSQSSTSTDFSLKSLSPNQEDGKSATQVKKEKVEEAAESSKFINVLNNVGNTFQNAGNSIVLGLNELAPFTNPGTAAAKMIGDQLGVQNKLSERLTKYINENNEQIEINTIARSYDPEKTWDENMQVANQGVTDLIEKGDYVAAIGEAGIKIAESSPYALISMGTGGLGGAAATGTTFFFSGYGSSIAEEYARDGNVDALEQSKSLIKGVIEGGTSILFGGISKYGKQIAGNVAKDQAKKVLSKNISSQLKSGFKTSTTTSLGEAAESLSEELSSYMVDVLYEDDEWNADRAFRISTDAFIIGLGSGAGFSSAGEGARLMNNYKYFKAKSLVNEETQTIERELGAQSTKDNPAKERYYKRLRSDMLGDIENKNVSDEDASLLDKRFFEIKELDGIITSTQEEALRNKAAEDKITKINEINQILAKYDGEQTGNKGSEQDGTSETMGDQAEPGVGEVDTETATTDDASIGSGQDVNEQSTLSQDAETESDVEANQDTESIADENPVDDDVVSDTNLDADNLSDSQRKGLVSILNSGDNNRIQKIIQKILPQSVNVSVDEKGAKSIDVDKQKGSSVFRRFVQDQSIKLKGLEKAIEKTVGSPLGRSAYHSLDLYKNAAAAEAKKIMDSAINSKDSFLKRVQSKGLDYDKFVNFLTAQHSPERNKRMRELGDERVLETKEKLDRLYDQNDKLLEKLNSAKGKKAKQSIGGKLSSLNKKISKMEEELDKRGVNSLMYGAGMTDEQSSEFMNSLDPEERKAYSEFADEFRNTYTKRILRDAVESGLITQEKADQIGVFEYYIPMKVEEMENSKFASGSDSGSSNIKGVSRGLKGIVGSTFEMKRVDPFMGTLNELMALQNNIAKNNVVNELINNIELAQSNNAKIQGISIGKARLKKNKDGTVEMTPPDKSYTDKNSIRFYKDGQMHFLKIADKELFNALTQSNQKGESIYSIPEVRAFSTFYRNINTVLNANFLTPNFIREFQASLTQMGLDVGDFKMRDYIKDSRKIAKAIFLKNIGKKISPEMDNLLNRFEGTGTKMSFNTLNDITSIGESVNKTLKNPKDKNFLSNLFDGYADFMYKAADISENVSRATVFKIAGDKLRASGDPDWEYKASVIAKEVTVNFRRRGELGNFLNAMKTFIGAGIQGSYGSMRALIGSKQVQRIAAGFFSYGIVEGMINDMLAGDDDYEFEMTPEFVKERNFIINLPKESGNKVIQIPVTFGLIGWFKYAGNKFYETGKNVHDNTYTEGDVFKVTGELMTSAFKSLAPFSTASVGQFLSPTAVTPMVQQIENKSFTGDDLYSDYGDRVKRIRSQQGRKNTPEIYKDVASLVNEATGGSLSKPGLIDWNPEIYENYVNSYTGGVGRSIERTLSFMIGSAQAMMGNSEAEIRTDDILILGSFLKEKNAYPYLSRVYDTYNNSQTKLFTQEKLDEFHDAVDRSVKEKVIDPERGLKLRQSVNSYQETLRFARRMDISYEEAYKKKKSIRNR